MSHGIWGFGPKRFRCEAAWGILLAAGILKDSFPNFSLWFPRVTLRNPRICFLANRLLFPFLPSLRWMSLVWIPYKLVKQINQNHLSIDWFVLPSSNSQ